MSMTQPVQSYSTLAPSVAPTNASPYSVPPGGHMMNQPLSSSYGHMMHPGQTRLPQMPPRVEYSHASHYASLNMQQQGFASRFQTPSGIQTQYPSTAGVPSQLPQPGTSIPSASSTSTGSNPTQQSSVIPPVGSVSKSSIPEGSLQPNPTQIPLQTQAQLGYQSPQLAYTSMMSQVRPSTIPPQAQPPIPVIPTPQIPGSNPAAGPIKMQPIVPQPGSLPATGSMMSQVRPSTIPPQTKPQMPVISTPQILGSNPAGRQTYPSANYPSPAPSPFQPIHPAPVSLEIVPSGTSQPASLPTSQLTSHRPQSIELERRSSLDDMLEAVEMNAAETPTVEVLQPKIMTPGEIEEQKLEAQAKKDIAIGKPIFLTASFCLRSRRNNFDVLPMNKI